MLKSVAYSLALVATYIACFVYLSLSAKEPRDVPRYKLGLENARILEKALSLTEFHLDSSRRTLSQFPTYRKDHQELKSSLENLITQSVSDQSLKSSWYLLNENWPLLEKVVLPVSREAELLADVQRGLLSRHSHRRLAERITELEATLPAQEQLIYEAQSALDLATSGLNVAPSGLSEGGQLVLQGLVLTMSKQQRIFNAHRDLHKAAETSLPRLKQMVDRVPIPTSRIPYFSDREDEDTRRTE